MKKGFTLIELLVVIAIIGLVSTITVLSFNRSVTGERKLDCSKYKFYSLNELPAGCINYFNNN